MKSQITSWCPLLASVVLAWASAVQAATISPYTPLLGWNAASESGVDAAWEPLLNPQSGTQVWTWNTTNPVSYIAVTRAATPGLTAAFRLDGQDEGLLSPSNPQSMPLDPTDQSASIEMWIRPSRLDGGRQVLLSFGGKTTGTSITLEGDVLRLQVRDSDVRSGIDTNSPPDGTNDDGLEDLVASIKTRLSSTNEFTHVVATIELGGTNQQMCLYLNGALAVPVNDTETGLFKDESLVAVGSSFAQVAGLRETIPFLFVFLRRRRFPVCSSRKIGREPSRGTWAGKPTTWAGRQTRRAARSILMTSRTRPTRAILPS